ncbi:MULTISPECIES: hypothetical protein [Eikenella]|uniref:hypothetical protein n=1 Tax=Eikenella TaxID=538 RepID=UPI0008A41383|nr:MULTISPECIES: hypothetical protein [Eikenella]OFN62070.1 hypothetical protein HMPREF2541_05780 [Eikenella sp. HMSC061C02]
MFKNKLAALAVMSSAFIATNSYAGAVADAVTTATTDFKADLAAVGGIAVAIGLIGVGFIAGIRLIKRAV